MQTIEEYKKYTKQLEEEVGQWHHAYDALLVERNQLVSKIMELEKSIREQAEAIAMKDDRIEELKESLRNVFIRTR
jgi:FtsZ-binding cell division protein ZapB